MTTYIAHPESGDEFSVEVVTDGFFLVIKTEDENGNKGISRIKIPNTGAGLQSIIDVFNLWAVDANNLVVVPVTLTFKP